MTDADFMAKVLADGRELPALICAATPAPLDRGTRTDDPMYPEIVRRRIARRVRVDENGCWIWTGRLNRKGYGNIGAFNSKSMGAHKASYHAFIDEEPLPSGWSLDHLCRNRSCANPFHLEAVPHGENVRRGNTGIAWSSRTHCGRGHEFTPENTKMRPGREGRQCRTCRREQCAERRAAKRRLV